MARAMISETSQSDQSNLGMIFSTLGQSSSINSSSWIIDSGATSHICHDLKLFDQYTLLSNRTITLPNNYKINVKAIGSVTLTPSIELSNVLYIPYQPQYPC